jgi:hypothetical protein
MLIMGFPMLDSGKVWKTHMTWGFPSVRGGLSMFEGRIWD